MPRPRMSVGEPVYDFFIIMTEIKTTDRFFTSEVDDKHLEEIVEDLHADNELVGFQPREDGTVLVLLDLAEIQTELSYIY